jgi:TonB family protein
MKKKILLTHLFFLVWTLSWAQVKLDSIDIPPLFEGCDDPLISENQRQACSVPKIRAFINQNIVYPDSARVKNIEGVVVVRFAVTEKGKITSLELMRDIGAGCGAEAMRVVRMMPDFRPALRNGQPVATKMTLPIRFKKINEAEANNKNLYQVHWGTAYSDIITKEKLNKLLKRTLIIRDYYGNIYHINYLTLKIKTNNKQIQCESKGSSISPEMLKALKKARANHRIVFIATIRKNYQDIEVTRALVVIK